MKIRNSGRALWLRIGIAALLLAGCGRGRQPETTKENGNAGAAKAEDEARSVTEKALGKQAEIVARGDLARNGLEQLLAVDRFAAARGGATPESSSAIFITRAVILEKSNGPWTEILRCDEHLKNPNGYLGSSTLARVNGWRLEFRNNGKQGLEMKFTPVDMESAKEGTGMMKTANQTVTVRWNPAAKRYQSLDSSHEEFLSEAPELETPHSILR